MGILECRDIRKVYNSSNDRGKIDALKGINLKVEEGEFLGIMGPSGSGKSTLMEILTGISDPHSGEIKLNGKEFAGLCKEEKARIRRDEMGIVFQDFNLLENLTVYENIAVPLAMEGCKKEESHRRIDEVLKKLGIDHIKDLYPRTISGGEKQRTAIARALIKNPRVIYADEPTGNLDSKSGRNIMRSFENINKEENISVIMVTHDPLMASCCDRVIFIKDGDISLQLVREGSKECFFERIKASQSYL